MASASPTLGCQVDLRPDWVRVRYEIENTTGEPIFVFDRLIDRSRRLDRDWAYVEIEGGRATLSRKAFRSPRPSTLEPDMPAARRLAPGERLSGECARPLPLAAWDPFYTGTHWCGKKTRVAIAELVFELGWAPCAGLEHPGHASVTVGSEEFEHVGYDDAIGVQRTVSSAPCAVDLTGVVLT